MTIIPIRPRSAGVLFVLPILFLLSATLAACGDTPGGSWNVTDGSERQTTQDDAQKVSGRQDCETDVKTDERRLFDGKSLDGWEKTNFGGERDVIVEDGVLIIESGYPLAGITSTLQDLPTSNYELRLKAKKIEGTDFFCCLTFPVRDSHLSLVVGGWGGTLVGLSCLDDQDAAHNETAVHKNFDLDRWYDIRLRVTDSKVLAWIDGEKVIDVDTSGRKLSLRNEVLANRPLGICTFETTAGIKDLILLRHSKAPEQEQPQEDAGTTDHGK